MNTRNSYWVKALDEARHTDGWYKLDKRYQEASAKQIASDIRNAHKRPNSRIRGIQPGESWSATVEDNNDGTWSILIAPASSVNA